MKAKLQKLIEAFQEELIEIKDIHSRNPTNPNYWLGQLSRLEYTIEELKRILESEE